LTPILDKIRSGDLFQTARQQIQNNPQQPPQQLDEDVAAEAFRINSRNGNIQDILELHRSFRIRALLLPQVLQLTTHVLFRITKIYPATSQVPEKVAVNDISLGIRTGNTQSARASVSIRC
jgi:hypothetical protein